MHQNNKLLVILGPTACGKTQTSIEIAKKYNGEIICADSRTIYRYMDIGTAKPTKQDRNEVKHYLLDIVEPIERYSVVEFKTECEKLLGSIWERGKLPLIVGGTGLYIDSVLFNYQFRGVLSGIDVESMSHDEKIQLARSKYPKEMIDFDEKNERRLTKLLQFGPSKNIDRQKLKYPCKIIGIMPNKPTLKQKIELRTKDMLNKGIVQETKDIISEFGRDCPGLNTIGYKQCVEYLDGKLPESELADAINRVTLGLAKRQITWFKRNPYIVWLEFEQQADAVVADYLAMV